MQPIDFQQKNFVFKRPDGLTEEECGDLAVFRGNDTKGLPVIISCWKLTEKELEEVKSKGVVWLTVYGTGTPPVYISGETPFIKNENDVPTGSH